MYGFMRLIRLLAITVWVGGLIFFAFVLAPAAFHTLPTIREAGLIVGATLRVFDIVALVCGIVFLAATAAMLQEAQGRSGLRPELLLSAAMVLATAYIQWSILPSMEADRRLAGGDITLIPGTHPARVHFDQLHQRSERVEGGVLALGLGVLFLMSREQIVREAR